MSTFSQLVVKVQSFTSPVSYHHDDAEHTLVKAQRERLSSYEARNPPPNQTPTPVIMFGANVNRIEDNYVN